MFQLMLFTFFFFLGILVLFWGLYNKINNQTRTLMDEHAQMRVLLRAMEARLDKMAQNEKINAMLHGKTAQDANFPETDRPDTDMAVQDPLMHLSFDQPAAKPKTINPGLDLTFSDGPGLNLQIPIPGKKET